MSGFWTAADRVRSGAPGDAAPRAPSRFEPEFGEAAMFEEEVAPLEAGLPDAGPVATVAREESQHPEARTAPRRSLEVAQTEDATPLAPLADDRHASPPPDIVAVPAAVPPAAPASIATPDAARPDPASDPVREVIERVVVAPATVAPVPPVAAPIVAEPVAAAAPVASVEALPPAAAPVLATPRDPVFEPSFAEPGIGADLAAPRIESAALEPVHVHIDRIEIRIDPPAAPPRVPATSQRARTAPVDLNDYLARAAR